MNSLKPEERIMILFCNVMLGCQQCHPVRSFDKNHQSVNNRLAPGFDELKE
ncbi:MAG: hypothetical protein ACP5D7_05395 [Limnospira sp.]